VIHIYQNKSNRYKSIEYNRMNDIIDIIYINILLRFILKNHFGNHKDHMNCILKSKDL